MWNLQGRFYRVLVLSDGLKLARLRVNPCQVLRLANKESLY